MTLPSGQTVGVSAAGDPLAERIVLFCLPTPGAGLFDPDPLVTSRWGVHLVTLDRPGYGSTPPLAEQGSGSGSGSGSGGRSDRTGIHDRADDLAEYLVHARVVARDSGAGDLGPVGVVGWGTGGMVALSLAARHPQLVDRVVTFQTAAPNGFVFDPSLQAVPPFGTEALGIPSDDPLLARPGLSNRLDRMLEEASLQGAAGVEADRRALVDASWSRELRSIRAEVRLAYADDMSTVDRYDGNWYRRRIRTSRVVRVSGGGALALATQWARVLAHVAPEHGGLPEHTRVGGPAERR
ncbi:alpha/beta fold hydrolase [Herbiconiux sp. A18JL235]|uniref:Alpha/beta fold hydrolase n=1 Tax=Herbiconiux sp. A18JL235 TaxID=3152363 RepID=A0AB39BC83_9MICO